MDLKNNKLIARALIITVLLLLSTSVFFFYKYMLIKNVYVEFTDKKIDHVYKISSLDEKWEFNGFIGSGKKSRHIKIDSLIYKADESSEVKSIKYKIYTFDYNLNEIDELLYSSEERFINQARNLTRGEVLLLKSGESIYSPDEIKMSDRPILQMKIEYITSDNESFSQIIDLHLSEYDMEPYL